MVEAEPSVDPARIRRLEEATLTTWPSLRQVFRDGWLLRFADGQTGRANAVTVLTPGDGPLDPRIDGVEAAYRAAGLPPRFRLTPLSDPGLDAALAARGYVEDDPAVVMTAPLRPDLQPDPTVRLADAADRGWIDTFTSTTGVDAVRRRAMEGIFARLVPPFAFAALGDDGAVAAGPFGALSLEAAPPETVAPDAVALGVVDGDLVCILEVATRPEVRGRGLARRAVGTLLAWGSGQGATTAMLQVGADNAPAIRLYRRLGFVEVYRYHYRVLAAG
jgi:ribosomal protein S18 acetylase RimI-like enzyme